MSGFMVSEVHYFCFDDSKDEFKAATEGCETQNLFVALQVKEKDGLWHGTDKAGPGQTHRIAIWRGHTPVFNDESNYILSRTQEEVKNLRKQLILQKVCTGIALGVMIYLMWRLAI